MIAMRRRALSVLVFVCALTTMSASPAFAAPGDLDISFSGDGKVTTNFTVGRDGAADVALQVDEKIVAAGRSSGSGGFGDFALARYRSNGSLDATFSGDGKATVSVSDGEDSAAAAAIQDDGRIVAAGGAALSELDSGFALARVRSNGTLDTTFSGDGKVITNFTAGFDGAAGVAIQDDGRIVAVGETGDGVFALARYRSDGSLDTTFGGDGKVTTSFSAGFAGAAAVAIDAEGRSWRRGRRP
jgi:uncharacterized delta-60 repeat protein